MWQHSVAADKPQDKTLSVQLRYDPTSLYFGAGVEAATGAVKCWLPHHEAEVKVSDTAD